MSQKKKSSIGFGPGAPSLILIFVVLALSVLSMLALMNGRNDAQLSNRSARVIESVYALHVRAEETRAVLDGVLAASAAEAASDADYLLAVEEDLPEGVALEDRDLVWSETDGSRVLECALRIQPLGESPREAWSRHVLVSAAAEEEDVEFDW